MKIKSDFALLDVRTGSIGPLEKALDAGPVAVTIKAEIDRSPQARGRFDGTSKEFALKVISAKAKP